MVEEPGRPFGRPGSFSLPCLCVPRLSQAETNVGFALLMARNRAAVRLERRVRVDEDLGRRERRGRDRRHRGRRRGDVDDSIADDRRRGATVAARCKLAHPGRAVRGERNTAHLRAGIAATAATGARAIFGTHEGEVRGSDLLAADAQEQRQRRVGAVLVGDRHVRPALRLHAVERVGRQLRPRVPAREADRQIDAHRLDILAGQRYELGVAGTSDHGAACPPDRSSDPEPLLAFDRGSGAGEDRHPQIVAAFAVGSVGRSCGEDGVSLALDRFRVERGNDLVRSRLRRSSRDRRCDARCSGGRRMQRRLVRVDVGVRHDGARRRVVLLDALAGCFVADQTGAEKSESEQAPGRTQDLLDLAHFVLNPPRREPFLPLGGEGSFTKQTVGFTGIARIRLE